MIEYDASSGLLEETFGIGGTARIEGLSQDDSGRYYAGHLTYETVTGDGTLSRTYEDGVLRKWGYASGEGRGLDFEGTGPGSFDSNGLLIDGVMRDSGTGTRYRISEGKFENLEIEIPADFNQPTPPAALSEPFFQKYALSNLADAGDAWLDRTAELIIGEAEDSTGWILWSTGVDSVKDILKGTITDVLRFGDQIDDAGRNWDAMWEDWKAGRWVDGYFKYLAACGNILTEVGRVLVIGSAAKGLATAAAKNAGRFTRLLELGEAGFGRVASEDLAGWINRMLKSTDPADLAKLKTFFKKNPAIKAKVLEGIRTGSRNIDDVAQLIKKECLTPADVKDFKIIKSADEVNASLKAGDPSFKNPYQPGTNVTEKITTEAEDYFRFWAEGTDSMFQGSWLVRSSEVDGLTSSQIKDLLGLECPPTNVGIVRVPAGVKIRQGIASEVAEWNVSGGGFQTELLEKIPDEAFNTDTIKSIGDKYHP